MKRGDFTPHVSFRHKLSVFYYLKYFYWLNNENVHKNSFIGLKTFFSSFYSFYSFTRCFARFFPTYLCTLVIDMLLRGLLHTVLDGGPR